MTRSPRLALWLLALGAVTTTGGPALVGCGSGSDGGASGQAGAAAGRGGGAAGQSSGRAGQGAAGQLGGSGGGTAGGSGGLGGSGGGQGAGASGQTAGQGGATAGSGGAAGSSTGGAGQTTGGAGGLPSGGTGQPAGGTGGDSSSLGGLGGGAPLAMGPVAGPLRPSADGHRLELPNGTPFFWLADTSYTIWHRSKREDVDAYLAKRRDQGFNVIKTYINVNGTGTPNRYGEEIFLSNGSPNPAFFEHNDYIISKADSLGLYVIVILYQADASFSTWLATRYKDRKNILWWPGRPDDTANAEAVVKVLSGKSVSAATADPAWNLLVGGPYVDTADAWNAAWPTLRTFRYFANEDPAAAYMLKPAKPVVWSDGQYEGGVCEQGDSNDPKSLNQVSALGLRRAAYQTVTRGGFYTYGCWKTWNFDPGWQDVIESPGVKSLGVFRRVFTSRPWHRYVPDQGVLTAVDSGDELVRSGASALRSQDGDAILAYVPGPGSVTVKLSSITKPQVRARWVDPRSGEVRDAGQYANTDAPKLTVPSGFEDAVLTFDGN